MPLSNLSGFNFPHLYYLVLSNEILIMHKINKEQFILPLGVEWLVINRSWIIDEFFITRKTIKWPYQGGIHWNTTHYQGGIIEILLLTQKHFVQLSENENSKELYTGSWGRWLIFGFMHQKSIKQPLCGYGT